MVMLLLYKKSGYYLITLYYSEHSKKSVEKVPAAKVQAQKEKVSLVENVRKLF